MRNKKNYYWRNLRLFVVFSYFWFMYEIYDFSIPVFVTVMLILVASYIK